MQRYQEEYRIVVIGGGTGLAVLLKGLKQYSSNLAAIVAVSDDGGSSGRLRAELGILPPGDIRSCLVALADTEELMDRIFQHRFNQGIWLEGHNLGNLLLVAMTEITGDILSAIRAVSKVLKVRGRVIPATLEQVILGAIMEDGTTVYGESAIRNYESKIAKVFFVPEQCQSTPEAIEAIKAAEAIVIGPGSIYTSIIPNLLVSSITEAIAESGARVIYISNIMTEAGESDDLDVLDHVNIINRYLGEGIIDDVLCNNAPIDQTRLDSYKLEKARPVRINDKDLLTGMDINIISEDLVAENKLAWHDSEKLACAVIKIINRQRQLLV